MNLLFGYYKKMSNVLNAWFWFFAVAPFIIVYKLAQKLLINLRLRTLVN